MPICIPGYNTITPQCYQELVCLVLSIEQMVNYFITMVNAKKNVSQMTNSHCVTVCPVAPNPMLMAVLELTELLLLLPSKWQHVPLKYQPKIS